MAESTLAQPTVVNEAVSTSALVNTSRNTITGRFTRYPSSERNT
jgi:hypothetical protein